MLPPAAGVARNQAKLAATLILYLPLDARAIGQGTDARGLKPIAC